MRRKNPNIETTYQKTVNLYNSGITDYCAIAQKLGLKESTVRTYISIARKNGSVEKNSLYKKIIDIYNLGITDPNEIAEKFGVSVSTVRKYINLGKEENLIKIGKNLYMSIIEMYNSGIKRYKEIATNLGISKETVKHYIARARKEGLVPPKEYKNSREKKQHSEQKNKNSGEKEQHNEPESKNTKQQTQEKIKTKSLEQKIRSGLIECVYPQEVAKILGIRTWQVYEYMENLNKEEAKKLKQDRLKNNPLYSVIVSRKKKEEAKDGVVGKILYDMKRSFVDYESRISLARIYFILENGKASEKILNEMIYNSAYIKSIIDKIKIEFDKVHLENIAMQIRNTYKNNHNMDGSNISYDDLCSRYNVRTGIVIDVLGMESIESEPER